MKGAENKDIFREFQQKFRALKICEELNIELGDAVVETFSDGEIAVNINETVREADVYVYSQRTIRK